MKKITFPLKPGQQGAQAADLHNALEQLLRRGADVTRLHTALRRLGYEISSDELNAARFGDRTFKAVLEFQNRHNLATTSIIDAGAAHSYQLLISRGQAMRGGDITSRKLGVRQ